MRITIKYLADFQRVTGKKEEVIVLNGYDKLPLKYISELLIQKYGAKMTPDPTVQIIVNGKLGELSKEIKDGDSIVIARVLGGG